jgi:hypothetical protein
VQVVNPCIVSIRSAATRQTNSPRLHIPAQIGKDKGLRFTTSSLDVVWKCRRILSADAFENGRSIVAQTDERQAGQGEHRQK